MVCTLETEINEKERIEKNTKTKKHLIENFDEDVDGDFVPCRSFLVWPCRISYSPQGR